MLHIVLYQPEIPPNTGNIIRLCANTGFRLHLIRPLGFVLDDKRLRRAGLDYGEWESVAVHDDWSGFRASVPCERIYGLTTKGRRAYTAVRYRAGDALVFGPETRGLPAELRDSLGEDALLRIPMQPHSRSLNLANSAAVVAYEAWRQLEFPGGA